MQSNIEQAPRVPSKPKDYTAAMPDSLGLIIGAMKSGTSALYNCIQEHPEVAPCCTKEPYYLSESDYIQKGMAGYAALWDWDPGRHKIAVEASTTYTKMPTQPNVAERLHAWSDGASPIRYRFIYMVRNPIDRINSHFFHIASRQEWTTQKIRNQLLDEAIAFSNYHYQIEPYARLFGRESILVLPYEEYCNTPDVVLQRCYKHLGLDPDYVPESLGERRNDGGWYRKQMRPAFWHKLRKLPIYHQAKKLIPLSMRESIATNINSKAVASTRLTNTEAKRAIDQLRDDLSRFCDTYAFDGHKWWGEIF